MTRARSSRLQAEEMPLREAADWFVRIHAEEAGTEDFAAWQQWLAEDPRHRRAFQQVEDFWEEAGKVENAPWPSIQDLGADRYLAKEPVAEWLSESQPQRERRVWYWPAAAAAALGMLAVGITLFVQRTTMTVAPDSAVLATQRAEDRKISLSDGSQVTLGAKSRIDIDLSRTARRISVDSGEAFFEVARDRKRPFVVSAGEGTITALGTAFNVRRLDERVVVTVSEGRVKVVEAAGDGNAGRVSELAAGEQLSYGPRPAAAHLVDPGVATAWRKGQLKYLNEPLKFVILDVSRYTDRKLVIDDAAIGDMLYTGTVLPEELDDWLSSVREAFPIDVRHEGGDQIVLVAHESLLR